MSNLPVRSIFFLLCLVKMTSRVEPDSASVQDAVPLGCFTPWPTGETVTEVHAYEQHLSLQSVEDAVAGDTVEWSVAGCGPDEGISLKDSFVKFDYYIQKAAAASMSGTSQAIDRIAPNVGFAGVNLIKRASMSLNGTPVCNEYDMYAQASLVDSMISRPARSLKASAAEEGWEIDEVNREGTVRLEATCNFDGTTDAVATLQVTNAQIKAAGLIPTTADGTTTLGDIRAGVRASIIATAGGGVAAFNLAYGHLVANISTIAGAAGQMVPSDNTDAGVISFAWGNLKQDVGIATHCIVEFALDPIAVNANRMRPTPSLDLGVNEGSLARRAQFLSGKANQTGGAGLDQPQNYRQHSVCYTPLIGAWRDTSYLPPDVSISLRLQLQDKERMFRCYDGASNVSAALANLTVKYVKATLYLKKYKYSPTIMPALSQHYSEGGTCKLNNMYVKHFTTRQDGGVTDVTLRNFLIGPRPEYLIIWTSLDSVATGTVPVKASTMDLCLEEGQSIKEAYLLVNGVVHPARRLTMDGSVVVQDAAGAIDKLGTLDMSEMYAAYRGLCADGSDPAISSAQFQRNTLPQLLCFDLRLSPDPNIASPILENCNLEARISLNKATASNADGGARIWGALGYYRSCITIAGDGTVRNDQN